MAFLQMLSSEATQNITYLCKKSVAVFDAARKSYSRAMKLMSYNDMEITAEGHANFVYTTIRDGCQVISEVC